MLQMVVGALVPLLKVRQLDTAVQRVHMSAIRRVTNHVDVSVESFVRIVYSRENVISVLI